MSATRGMLRSLAEACCTPAGSLDEVESIYWWKTLPAGKFVTLVYAVLHPASRNVTFASAGHLHPLLVDDSGARFLDTERGLPLGLSCGDYSETSVTLAHGSRLVFYSDGISEAVNDAEEEYGLERLVQHVSGPERFRNHGSR